MMRPGFIALRRGADHDRAPRRQQPPQLRHRARGRQRRAAGAAGRGRRAPPGGRPRPPPPGSPRARARPRPVRRLESRPALGEPRERQRPARPAAPREARRRGSMRSRPVSASWTSVPRSARSAPCGGRGRGPPSSPGPSRAAAPPGAPRCPARPRPGPRPGRRRGRGGTRPAARAPGPARKRTRSATSAPASRAAGRGGAGRGQHPRHRRPRSAAGSLRQTHDPAHVALVQQVGRGDLDHRLVRAERLARPRRRSPRGVRHQAVRGNGDPGRGQEGVDLVLEEDRPPLGLRARRDRPGRTLPAPAVVAAGHRRPSRAGGAGRTRACPGRGRSGAGGRSSGPCPRSSPATARASRTCAGSRRAPGTCPPGTSWPGR